MDVWGLAKQMIGPMFDSLECISIISIVELQSSWTPIMTEGCELWALLFVYYTCYSCL